MSSHQSSKFKHSSIYKTFTNCNAFQDARLKTWAFIRYLQRLRSNLGKGTFSSSSSFSSLFPFLQRSHSPRQNKFFFMPLMLRAALPPLTPQHRISYPPCLLSLAVLFPAFLLLLLLLLLGPRHRLPFFPSRVLELLRANPTYADYLAAILCS